MKTDSYFHSIYARARNGGRTRACVAIKTARRSMGALETARRAYLDANPKTGDSEAAGALPIDAGDGHKARAAYVDAIARAGGFNSARVWARRYPEAGDGLRPVGDIEPGGFRGADWHSGGHRGGYYCNPWGESWKDGDGLAWGTVYQLPSRRGLSRFVAGYQFGGIDGGPTLDLATVYTCPAQDCAQDGARESGAMAAADSMAQTAAEAESEYQAAWRAGRDWAEAAETVAEARRNALALLVERRDHKARGPMAPAICRAIADSVSGWRATMATAREEMAEAVDSVYDDSSRAAFCEAAGVDWARVAP